MDGDGCDVNCMWSCQVNADCAAADACSTTRCDTGLHVCVAGQPVDCEDGDPCTQDACDPAAGCTATPIDADGDGAGPGETCGMDCNDSNANVHVGQTAWFAAPIPGAPPQVDFDYNCDGRETELYISSGSCRANTAFHCRLASRTGWSGGAPACGETGRWASGCTWNGSSCQAAGGGMALVQECQ